MLSFNWNSIDDSTFQGYLNKYTNAFKGYQTRYFVIDDQLKILLYFTPDDVRKKGPRGFIELTDCWVSPSNEDDVTFTVQTSGGEICKLRAMNAKGRHRWIDRIRACSGSNAASLYVSSLPVPKATQASASPVAHSPNETRPRRNSKSHHHEQTVKELREVMRCVAVNQREFVETIDAMPEDIALHALSTDMLLLRSVSQSCIHSLQDSLDILTRRRTPENEALAAPVLQSQASTATNAYNRQSSQPSNSNASVKSSLTAPSNRTSTFSSASSYNETASASKPE